MPKSNKATQCQRRLRLNLVMKMIIDGLTTNDIIRLVNTPSEQKGLGWNIGSRQVYNYVSICYKMIEKEFKKEESEILQAHKIRRLELYRSAKKSGQHQAALNALESLATFEGVSKKELDINIKGRITLEDIEDLIERDEKNKGEIENEH